MQKIIATPKPGLRVRKEDGSPLAEAGEAVDRTAFWLRRQADGDVTLGKLPAATAEAAPDAPTTKRK